MGRKVTAALLVLIASAALGCGAGIRLGKPRTTNPSANAHPGKTEKECAACEKMCAVAGDAEGNREAVEACQNDCRRSCRG